MMKFIRLLLTASLASFLMTGCITVNAKSIDYEATETLNLSAQGITELKIDAHAGFLIIEGDSHSDSIEVTADIAAFAESYRLSLEKRGGTAVLIADPNSKNISSWFGANSAKIDLTVRVPKSMKLSIQDGSGYIDIKNIDGDITIDDGSGDLTVKNTGGSLNIEDGSGGIELAHIKGAIKIDDGSGNIDITDTQSSVEINDGSGEMKLANIGGKIDLEDGSGDLLINGAKGHVTIDDGSGDIDVVDLEDGLTVLNSGSGGLSMSKVKGDVETR